MASTTASFQRIANRYATVDGVLRSGPRPSPTVVLYTHPRSQTNLSSYPCPDLAELGIDTLAFNNRFTNSPAGTDVATVFEEFAWDVAAAVEHVRSLGYANVVLLGWSAGGPTMAFYQHVAERGIDALSPTALSGFAGFVDDAGRVVALPAADGVVLRSVTIGTAASFLIRLDGAVTDEATSAIDPDLDIYSPAHGFDHATGAATYDPDFLRRYYQAQAARMNRLIDDALERVEDMARGRARFADDDFVLIPRTRANPTTVDRSLAHRSTRPAVRYPDGTIGLVEDVRPINHEYRQNPLAAGAAVHRLRAMLSYRLTRVDANRFDPHATTADASGVDFASTNNSTPTNLSKISVPVLVIQGSGDESNSVKIPTAELNAAAGPSDTTLAFVAGAMHSFHPAEERFGDTRAIGARAIADWIRARYPV